MVAYLEMIENAWEGTDRTLTSAWQKLWLESVVEYDLEGLETVSVETVVNEIVYLAKINGLEVDDENLLSTKNMKSTMVLCSVPLICMQYLKQKKVVPESLEAAKWQGQCRAKWVLASNPPERWRERLVIY
ncbi:hypothetical protein AVEN_270567-1 [Araneus ventricosus]|uniref:Uncharacterized protein n=1 Tax=Araneus ventricosus TaxID=182803 RepID=A0A4Y2B8D7_ARAVE|nr:hypothetical protein AVEN_270567-1 [Araneus ventricosus]